MGPRSRREFLQRGLAVTGLGLLAGCGLGLPGMPRAAKPRRVGILYGNRPTGPWPEVDVLRDRLRELGWSEPERLILEVRGGDGTPANL